MCDSFVTILLFVEGVADAAHGADDVVAVVNLFHFLADAVDVCAGGVTGFGGGDVVAVNGLHDVLGADHAGGLFGEVGEDVELEGAEFEGDVVEEDGVAGFVNDNTAVL